MQLIQADSWQELMAREMAQDYWPGLMHFVKTQYHSQECFPPQDQIFRAFELTPLDKVNVVILGQDPYHGFGQAHGLAFSVPEGIAQPPSLRNILKEVHQNKTQTFEIDNAQKIQANHSGDLSHWAEQGVLLLNSVLTVASAKAGSHQKKGWEQFTNAAIKEISTRRTAVVFMLWGRFAHGKTKLIDSSKHLILACGHPSPLSANRGMWFGNDHFNQANDYLSAAGKKSIDW
jgi:uracil-DNA glycosylase